LPADKAQEADGDGKKIFLLYPHSVIKEEMLDILIMNGFETYTLHDHKRAKKLFEIFPDSIAFINIDEGMQEKEWEAYIRDLMQNPKTKNFRIGILSYNQDKDLMQKYLMDISVPCGYIQLKLGVQASTKIIINALEVNEARGRRKYLRANCEDDSTAAMNFKHDNQLCQGKIIDISAVGIAARITCAKALVVKSVIKEIQFRLRGTLIMTDMIFIGTCSDRKDVCIFLFDHGKLTQNNKNVIYHFIKQTLQRFIDHIKI